MKTSAGATASPRPPEFAVFMTNVQVHPDWSSIRALDRATHPVGTPPGWRAHHDQATAQARAGSAQTGPLDASKPPSGVACWFQDTGRSVIVGFLDFRYVLELGPGKPADLKRQAWPGHLLSYIRRHWVGLEQMCEPGKPDLRCWAPV